MFETIDEKYQSGQELSPEETEYYCSVIRQAPKDFYVDDIENYEICHEYWFNFLFMKSIYGLNSLPISYSESQKLNKILHKWYEQIRNTRHSENLLKYMATEIRKEIKEMEKNTPYKENTNLQINCRKKILALSKHLYITLKYAYCHLKDNEVTIFLNNKKIILDEKFLVHVTKKHFCATSNLHLLDKSYFSKHIDYNSIDTFLQETFHIIDNSGLYKNQDINKISFQYKNISYTLYINKITKSYHKVGNIKVNALSTFYPIEDERELLNLALNFTLQKINTDYSVYLKKT